MHTLSNQALALRDKGFSVIPLQANDKKPAIKWEAYQTERATPEEVSQWFAVPRNVGIVTGAVSGVVVLDVDRPDALSVALPRTPTVKTPRGHHYYFRHPGSPVGNKVGLLKGVDLRGDGGYVVAPPSVVNTAYEWTIGLEQPLAEIPDWLKPTNDNQRTTEYGRAWFKDVEALTHTQSGRRNDLLNQVACKAGSLIASGHLNETEARAAMLHACRCNRLIADDGEIGVLATIKSGLDTGICNPRHPVETVIPPASPGAKLFIQSLSEIEEKPISWLWHGVLAKGAISLFAGPAGTGKSTASQDIGARISSGDYWPASKERAPIGNVLVLSLEDDAAARIKPRMIEAGADINRVHVIRGFVDEEIGETFNLGQHIPLLGEAMEAIGSVSLVMIDPVTAYMGRLDSNQMGDVRRVMTSLTQLAEKFDAAILLVSHLNKNEAASAINRVQGSGAFVQAVRCYYVVEKDKDDPSRRVISPAKNNLARDDRGFAFRLESRTRPSGDEVQKAVWEDQHHHTTADQLLVERQGDGYALTEAMEFLEHLLGNGPVPYAQVRADAQKAGISQATLYRAKEKLDASSIGKGRDIAWTLHSQPILN